MTKVIKKKHKAHRVMGSGGKTGHRGMGGGRDLGTETGGLPVVSGASVWEGQLQAGHWKQTKALRLEQAWQLEEIKVAELSERRRVGG